MQAENSSALPIGRFYAPRFDAPAGIAVFRALQLGDMLCTVPALRALRAAAPRAQITLIGVPWAASFAQRYAKNIDDFIVFPGYPGMPERQPELESWPGFLAEAQKRKFGLVLQMHGSGLLSNPLTALFGAQRQAGFYQAGQYCPDPERFIVWDEREHEVLRYLRLMKTLGIAEQGTELEFPLHESDWQELQQAFAELGEPMPKPGGYACVHPGARLPSRRWPAEYFAALADRLADSGLRIVLTGSSEEAPLTAAVRRAMRHPALDFTGRTGLGALAALLAQARLIACNDTGVSHVAAAVGTPSVVVCSGADPARWAPLDAQRHRVLHRPIACRPCMHFECPFADHPCARQVSPDSAWQAAQALLEACASAKRENSIA